MKFDKENIKKESTEDLDSIAETDNDLEELTSNEKGSKTTIKQWLQDNLRIIVSVLIVVLIAGGIYSYSQRSEAPNKENGVITNQTTNQEEQTANQEKNQESTIKKTTAEKKTPQEETTTKKKTVSSTTSQETEKSFVETAAKGDSQTTLAREALANFLAKNADSSLTAEHKIYIEDYLRKNVATNKHILIGTSVEFSKSLIQKAITQSKTLSDSQLKNLHKYTLRVTSLS